MSHTSLTIPSKKAVRRAGETLRKIDASDPAAAEALKTLSAWRAMYYSPINTVQMLLRNRIAALKIESPIIAQRLKRTPSIIAKLKRFPNMQLDRMQDIGGIRAVVNSVEEVRRVHDSLMNGRHGHEPVMPPKDYITEPKPDGYRGIHQVFKYGTTQHAELEGLLIEVQIRSKLQHFWATAVETLGVIEKSSFKTGGGDEEFRKFFRLSSALFSIKENAPILQALRDKTPEEIAGRFEELEHRLKVFDKLSSFTSAVKAISGVENSTAGYYLLMLDSSKKESSFIPFAMDQGDLAEHFYALAEGQERANAGIDVVLAAAADMKDLRTAYPNYFVDTREFISNLRSITRQILDHP